MLRQLNRISIYAFLCVISSTGLSHAHHQRAQHSTIPSARMNPSGHLTFKLETLDPYVQTSVGMQLHDSFYAQLRQTAETSSLRGQPDRLYPGLDFKFRLLSESNFIPETSIGVNNALGQTLLASEYITASKRFKSFDFTGGIAWGKLGGAGHINNPLKHISSHFEKDRPLTDENSNTPDHWFTGPDVGFFGGISYQTPWSPLLFNIDWSADRYAIERGLVSDFNKPNPWSFGATFHANDALSFHGALVGGEKFLGRMTYAPNLSKIKTNRKHIGVANRIQQTDKPDVTARYMGLIGKRYFLPERQIYSDTATPSELWHDLEINKPAPEFYFKTHTLFKPRAFRLILEQNYDISSKLNGVLARTSAIVDTKTETALGLITGLGLRVNLADDLTRNTLPSANTLTRRDTVFFAEKRLNLDRFYLAKNYSVGDVHTQISLGYLEEMFAGYGGQILYRPYGKTYAFGAEAWDVVRRDPFSNFGTKVTDGSGRWTGHLNGYYELPDRETTLHAKVGRYLGEDYGGTFSVSRLFKNGIDVTGHFTHTSESTTDLFSGQSNSFAGLSLSIPLKVKRLPKPLNKACCDTAINVTQFTRDTGQSLQHPLPLYKISEPLSHRHLIHYWDEVR